MTIQIVRQQSIRGNQIRSIEGIYVTENTHQMHGKIFQSLKYSEGIFLFNYLAFEIIERELTLTLFWTFKLWRKKSRSTSKMQRTSFCLKYITNFLISQMKFASCYSEMVVRWMGYQLRSPIWGYISMLIKLLYYSGRLSLSLNNLPFPIVSII